MIKLLLCLTSLTWTIQAIGKTHPTENASLISGENYSQTASTDDPQKQISPTPPEDVLTEYPLIVDFGDNFTEAKNETFFTESPLPKNSIKDTFQNDPLSKPQSIQIGNEQEEKLTAWEEITDNEDQEEITTTEKNNRSLSEDTTGFLDGHETLNSQNNSSLNRQSQSENYIDEMKALKFHCNPLTNSSHIKVNKCCGKNEFFNLEKKECDSFINDTEFSLQVESIFFPDSSLSVHARPFNLEVCPGTNDKPEKANVNSDELSFDDSGNLCDYYLEVTYDHSRFCLELAAENSNDSDNAVLKFDYCVPDLIRKCCSSEMMMNSSGSCDTNTLGLNLLEEQSFVEANVNSNDLRFQALPDCPEPGYHVYEFVQHLETDFATLSKDKTMKIVSMTNGCFEKEYPLKNKHYCIEYMEKENFTKGYVLVCSNTGEKKIFQEKFTLVATLLSISCIALALTAVAIIRMRAQRGVVFVKKANTLVGRIQLSYVLSYFMGFMLIAIAMTVNMETGLSCRVFGGFSMFFILAAFHWNTSICFEPLLLTIWGSAGPSERIRYLCHSLWAWGLPGLITATAFTIDYYADSLPCSIIRPRIGDNRCFLSNQDAKLLYLYLPMFITLCANTALLLAARMIRNAKLRNLEKGGPNHNHGSNDKEKGGRQKSADGSETKSADAKRLHSGLRTHQTRDLWTEAMVLVLWSGITWLAEIAASLEARFHEPTEAWYNYLWYIPTIINSLRGVGIFYIIVLTPRTRKKLSKQMVNQLQQAGIIKSRPNRKQSRTDELSSTSNAWFSLPFGKRVQSRDLSESSMSTAITQISFRSTASFERSITSNPVAPTEERRPSTVSQLTIREEEFESDIEQ